MCYDIIIWIREYELVVEEWRGAISDTKGGREWVVEAVGERGQEYTEDMIYCLYREVDSMSFFFGGCSLNREQYEIGSYSI